MNIEGCEPIEVDAGEPRQRRPPLTSRLLDGALHGAAREFLARPSKRLRARLIDVAYAVAGGVGRPAAQASEMIELLHSGSLIVDDIQDGAVLRRGAPALHRQIGVPRALNTGNWLYFVALTRLDELPIDPARAQDLSRATHRCLVECHEGQSLDLTLTLENVNAQELPAVAEAVSDRKTGAPMGLSARLGGVLAGAQPHEVDALVRFGERVGRALQMLDDLGSVTSPARFEKGLEDLQNRRVGWVWAWASEVLDGSSLRDYIAEALSESDLRGLCVRLAQVVEPLGRSRVRSFLEETERDLWSVFPERKGAELVSLALAQLQRSYG